MLSYMKSMLLCSSEMGGELALFFPYFFFFNFHLNERDYPC